MPENSVPARGNATRAIALLACAAFATQAMVRSTDSLLPQIANDLQTTVGAASVVVTFYLLAHGSVQLIIGPIGDRFGKYLCVSIAAAVADVDGDRLRPGADLAAAGRCPPRLRPRRRLDHSLRARLYRRRHSLRAAPAGARPFLSGQILGQLFGQAAGGVLGDYFGWRNVFFMLAALFAIAAIGLFYELARNPITHARNAPTQQGHGFVADYTTVLRSPWARIIILMAFIESAAMFGAFAYVGADLHLRFGLSFTVVGLFVGFFALGGLVYSLSVRRLMRGSARSASSIGGGGLLALAFITLAVAPVSGVAPLAIAAIGLGFLHAAQHAADERDADVAAGARHRGGDFFVGALSGSDRRRRGFGWMFDRYTAVPVFVTAAVVLAALGFGCRTLLKQRAEAGL